MVRKSEGSFYKCHRYYSIKHSEVLELGSNWKAYPERGAVPNIDRTSVTDQKNLEFRMLYGIEDNGTPFSNIVGRDWVCAQLSQLTLPQLFPVSADGTDLGLSFKSPTQKESSSFSRL